VKVIRTILPVAAILALPVAGAAQQPFEGSVTYRMQSSGQTITMVHHVRGENIRVDMEAAGQSISVISDMKGTRQLMVMHGMRQYMDAAAMQQRMGGGAGAGAGAVSPADIDIKATGRKDTIAGHQCEYYIVTSQGQEVEICAASGLGWYFAGGAPSGPGSRGGNQGVPGLSNAQQAEWQRKFANGFFPLKVSVKDPTPLTMEVTEISRKSVDAGLFQPPAGYTEMRIGG
jgi:hypothetical protein